MNIRKKAIVYVGVDISKGTFNSAIGKRDGIHPNNTDGFIAFLANIGRLMHQRRPRPASDAGLPHTRDSTRSRSSRSCSTR